jgi:hypothetical protein
MNRNLSKIRAAENKEMLLSLYAQWQKSHPTIVAKYPSVNPLWGWRRIDRVTTQIGREIYASALNSERKGENDNVL